MRTAAYEALLHAPGNGLGGIYKVGVEALGLDPDAVRSIQRSGSAGRDRDNVSCE